MMIMMRRMDDGQGSLLLGSGKLAMPMPSCRLKKIQEAITVGEGSFAHQLNRATEGKVVG